MRTEKMPPRCAWCGRFRTTQGWVHERRAEGERTYSSHGICPACKEVFFPTFTYEKERPATAGIV